MFYPSHPFATPSSPKNPQNHNFKHYFTHFCVAVNVTTLHGGAKSYFKMGRNGDFGGILGEVA